MKKEKFDITGMTCAACQANITKRVQKLGGIQNVNVNLLANQMTVDFDEAKVSADEITAAVIEIGYGAEVSGKSKNADSESGFKGEWHKRQEKAKNARDNLKRRLIASVILLVPLMYIAMGHMMGLPVPSIFVGVENALITAFTQLLLTITVVIINSHYYTTGFKALWKRTPNMDSLVAIGSSAALVYGIFAIYRMAYGMGHGDMMIVEHYLHQLYFESCAMIVTLVDVGKYLEARSKAKTSDALGKLVELAPKTATIIRDGVERTIPAEQVVEGDIVVIRPGESLPVDGVVLEGHGYVDQSAITGESIPVEKAKGDQVISATINKNGTFKYRASKVGDDTTLAQIIRLVDEAGSSKAPIARMADKVSGVFVPVVIGIAILTTIVWIIAGQGFEFALSCGISVLVISCPCALGLATPVAIMVGTGKAAEHGILIKSAESLENLHSVDTIVLDKTGTITAGHPSVTDIIPLVKGLCERDFLTAAAAIEAGSEHPLGEAVVEKAKSLGITIPKADNFNVTSGRGVTAELNGDKYVAGNLAFIKESAIPQETELIKRVNDLASQGKTPLVFAKNGKVTGVIAVSDTVRESSRQAIESFRNLGLRVVMLTGDNKVTAEAIKNQLGIEEAISDVLPTEKEAHIRKLMEVGHKVAMVGDGINDAPALTRANIGIAIGAGADIAIEAADIVLMKDSLQDVVTAIELSHSVIKNIHMNLFWAFFYNILGIPLAAGVLYPALKLVLSPMIGSAAMSLSSVCVVSNALRLRWFKPKNVVNETQLNIEEEIPLEMKGNDTMKKTLVIEGMMCMHCQRHVTNALQAVEGVQEVDVNLESKTATVVLASDVADDVLASAVTEQGYTVVSVN